MAKRALAEVEFLNVRSQMLNGARKLFKQAMATKGYPLDPNYITQHIVQTPCGSDGMTRFFHDGELFLEIKTEFDRSTPKKIVINHTPFLY